MTDDFTDDSQYMVAIFFSFTFFLVLVKFGQSFWWGCMNVASDIARRQNLAASSLILWLLQFVHSFVHLVIQFVCLCVCAHAHLHVCVLPPKGVGQNTTLGSYFFLPTLWVLEIESGSSGLAACAFTYWSTSRVPSYLLNSQTSHFLPHLPSSLLKIQYFSSLAETLKHTLCEFLSVVHFYLHFSKLQNISSKTQTWPSNFLVWNCIVQHFYEAILKDRSHWWL